MKNIDFKIFFKALDDVGIRASKVLHIGSNNIMDVKVLQQELDKKGINYRPSSVEDFYKMIGFEEVTIVDLADIDDWPQEQYELVVNPGSTAALLDQRKVFDAMYDRTLPNGFQIHIVPFLSTLDNEMYSYKPYFFYYIAEHQNHEILKAYFCNYVVERCMETTLYDAYSGFKYESEFGMNFLQNENWTSHIGLGVVYRKKVLDVQEND